MRSRDQGEISSIKNLDPGRGWFYSPYDSDYPLLCETSGALHLAQPGLTAGRLADEIQVNFEIFKIGCRSKNSTCHFV